MRSREEVRPALDDNELCRGTVGEQFDLLLCVGDSVHNILCSLDFMIMSSTLALSCLIPGSQKKTQQGLGLRTLT